MNVFSARFQHFWFGVAFLLTYVWIKRQRQEGIMLLHPLALAVALPVLYLGSALPDWDIKLLGIGAHRNPLFHSAAAYFCLAYLWRCMGLERTVHTAAGVRLKLAAQVGFALGLSSHLVLDMLQYGDVRWLSGSTLDKAWLGVNAAILGLAAWYPQRVRNRALSLRSTE
jgi:LexA-binding, inner membrane-associated putative hydrolase